MATVFKVPKWGRVVKCFQDQKITKILLNFFMSLLPESMVDTVPSHSMIEIGHVYVICNSVEPGGGYDVTAALHPITLVAEI